MPPRRERRSRGPCPNTERSDLEIDTPVWLPPTIATLPDCTCSSILPSEAGRCDETVRVSVLESHRAVSTAPATSSVVAEPTNTKPHGVMPRTPNSSRRCSRTWYQRCAHGIRLREVSLAPKCDQSGGRRCERIVCVRIATTLRCQIATSKVSRRRRPDGQNLDNLRDGLPPAPRGVPNARAGSTMDQDFHARAGLR